VHSLSEKPPPSYNTGTHPVGQTKMSPIRAAGPMTSMLTNKQVVGAEGLPAA